MVLPRLQFVPMRICRWDVILGYSQPLGFPARFDHTLLAQIGYRAHGLESDDVIATIGLGLRQQIGV